MSGYTTQQIVKMAKALGRSCSKQSVSEMSRRRKWEKATKLGYQNVYAESDVQDYLFAIRRTKLAEELGIHAGPNLIWDDTNDGQCIECDALDHWRYQISADEIVYHSVCENGHKHEFVTSDKLAAMIRNMALEPGGMV